MPHSDSYTTSSMTVFTTGTTFPASSTIQNDGPQGKKGVVISNLISQKPEYMLFCFSGCSFQKFGCLLLRDFFICVIWKLKNWMNVHYSKLICGPSQIRNLLFLTAVLVYLHYLSGKNAYLPAGLFLFFSSKYKIELRSSYVSGIKCEVLQV